MSQEQLDRIENGIRFLVKTLCYPYRCANDGKPADEQLRLAIEEETQIDEAVDRVMKTGSPYETPQAS